MANIGMSSRNTPVANLCNLFTRQFLWSVVFWIPGGMTDLELRSLFPPPHSPSAFIYYHVVPFKNLPFGAPYPILACGGPIPHVVAPYPMWWPHTPCGGPMPHVVAPCPIRWPHAPCGDPIPHVVAPYPILLRRDVKAQRGWCFSTTTTTTTTTAATTTTTATTTATATTATTTTTTTATTTATAITTTTTTTTTAAAITTTTTDTTTTTTTTTTAAATTTTTTTATTTTTTTTTTSVEGPKTWREEDVVRAHRVGQTTGDRPRPVIVKFRQWRDKLSVITDRDYKARLAAQGVKIANDLTRRQAAIVSQAKEEGKAAYFVKGKLTVGPRRPDPRTYAQVTATTPASPGAVQRRDGRQTRGRGPSADPGESTQRQASDATHGDSPSPSHVTGGGGGSAGRQKSEGVQRCGEQAGSKGGGSGDSQASRGARGVRGGPRRGAQHPVLHGDNLTDSSTDKIRRSSRQK
ncbi:hypothetical protein ACOMHN_053278 [Nucella lapillus]